MNWVEGFYSKTGAWWGDAESRVDETDRWRAAFALELTRTGASALELGCGYGSTAHAMAEAGLAVTAIDFSERVAAAVKSSAPDGPHFRRGDFYIADLGNEYELVCYWDGFGVGTDEDQRRLLRRISNEWLAADGIAVIEVFEPFWWAAHAGFEETKEARPDEGYHYSLRHSRGFDSATCRALDTWWEFESSERWTQSLRCYSPADLDLLLEGTALRVRSLEPPGRSEQGDAPAPADGACSYLAVLGRV